MFDTEAWISQVQGPRSMDVLADAVGDGMPERFRYFDLAEVRIGGQPVVISRTGFTNELGWEFYLGADADPEIIGDRILEAGETHGFMWRRGLRMSVRDCRSRLWLSGREGT